MHLCLRHAIPPSHTLNQRTFSTKIHYNYDYYLIRSECFSNLLYERLIGGVVSGGVKNEHKIEYECISFVLLIINALRAAHHSIPGNISGKKTSWIFKTFP